MNRPLTLVAGLLFISAAAATPREASPTLALPTADVTRALARADADRQRPHGPQRIAVEVPVAASLAAGAWTTEGTESVWRLQLVSTGAPILIAHLRDLHLPHGATLTFSNADGTEIQGPFTQADAHGARDFWTPMVRGDRAILEVRAPIAERDAVRLRIAAVAHGLLDPTARAVEPKSGSCNIDVVCPQGDGWRDEIRSVVRLQIPSSPGFVSLCTGQLVNDQKQDGKPYILTADHCGATSSNAANVIAYWKFKTSTCGGTPDGSTVQNQKGAIFRAGSNSGDYTLLELSAAPKLAFNAFFSGYDASAIEAPQSGVTIHHPAGDEKRISVYDTPGKRVQITLEGHKVDAWKVLWSQGVTEQGSSGAGLWNQHRQVVGVLSGGASSCANPGGADFYGRLDQAWITGLSQFLDPDATGVRLQCGRDPNTTCTTEPNVDPVAGNNHFVVIHDSAGRTLRVLGNDSDADGDVLLIRSVGTPSKGGTATISADRKTIRYVPKAGFIGTETFSYRAGDGHGGTDAATVTIDVTAS